MELGIRKDTSKFKGINLWPDQVITHNDALKTTMGIEHVYDRWSTTLCGLSLINFFQGKAPK